MNRDDIIRMAREAGEAEGLETVIFHPVFERFAALVAAAERDRCCRIVFECCDSDNTAQRTVDKIRGEK